MLSIFGKVGRFDEGESAKNGGKMGHFMAISALQVTV
jgi:hypothetical protein